MRITINGIEYESVDTQIVEGMDIGCKDCDIFKAKIPRSPAVLPLCFERGNEKTRQSCYNMACRGYKRIWKKV